MIIGIDTETTGLPGRDPDVRITQLAVVTPDKATSYLLRLPPDAPYSDEAAAITGLSRERLEAEGLDPAKVLGAFAKKLAGPWREATFVAHNADFDRGRLVDAFVDLDMFDAAALVERLQWACTLKAARKLWRGQPNHLQAVCERLDIAFNEAEAHDASYDAAKAIEVYQAILAGRHKQPKPEPEPLQAEVVRELAAPARVSVPAVTLDTEPLVTAAQHVAEQLAPFVADAQGWADALEVGDATSEAEAIDAIGRIRKAISASERSRKTLTDALGPAKREIDRTFREGIKRPLEAAAKAAQAKIDEHARAEYERREAEAENARRAALEAAEAGDDSRAEAELDRAEAASTTEATATDSATARVRVTYTVDLVEDEDKVERRFLSPDMGKAQRFVDAFVHNAGGSLDSGGLEALRAKLPGFRVSRQVAKTIRRRS